ncbi:MAG TPA: sensor domain-containing diguanylate cyclase [Actinomycetota bacterium]|nr:sensor domain-containing diguanylate cyclase [Actinomycetota bacterium]
MIPPPIPSDEQDRLATLHALQILDTEPEERFDRVTRLAQRLFDVPIALVSLIDAERQWFKSKIGLEASETSREVSFCAHAIAGEGILHVPDAREDPRFHDNPDVLGGANIRFYAGCPIQAPDGRSMGTLCIVDDQPRHVDEEALSSLRDLAEMVEQELAALALAVQDELTGLANRRGFVGLAAQVLAVAMRQGLPATLAYIDLDGFKAINDTHGHAVGDRALQDVARILTESCRSSDVLGRLGGDEFALLFLAEESAAPLDRLHDAVARHNDLAGRPYRLQLSVGTARFDPEEGVGLEELMERADRSMYERKARRQRASA